VRRLAILVAATLLLGGCGRAQGVADTRRALERAGYRNVEVSLRSGGGIGVARVEVAGGPGVDPAAEAAWATLPVRFDQLVVAHDGRPTSFGYDDLERRFGLRDPGLDGRQVDEEVVRSGLKLMLLLSAGALLSVGVVVTLGLLAVRAGRRVRRGDRQAEGPTSGLGAASLIAEVAGASEEAEEMPS